MIWVKIYFEEWKEFQIFGDRGCYTIVNSCDNVGIDHILVTYSLSRSLSNTHTHTHANTRTHTLSFFLHTHAHHNCLFFVFSQISEVEKNSVKFLWWRLFIWEMLKSPLANPRVFTLSVYNVNVGHIMTISVRFSKIRGLQNAHLDNHGWVLFFI